MTENLDGLVGALAGIPSLPGARCRGRAPLFDCDDDDPEIIQYAIWQCRACPALADCRDWVTTLRPSQRPSGVTAAVMRRPGKQRRSRAAQTDGAEEDGVEEDLLHQDLLHQLRERNP